MRFGAILAIAWRDLRIEFSGRRFGLLGIILLLLGPAVAVEAPERSEAVVSGRVPDHVRDAEGVRVAERGGVQMVPYQGVLQVFTFFMPPEVREALDDGDPVVRVEVVQPPVRWPKRSLLFALIAASTLTGSVSSSIGGERTNRTLQALLSASVTRLEVVLGKWLAWGGFGATVAMLAATAAVAWGKQSLGPWILALPLVPAFTVALGLWLVRRTDDVIAGTSVSLRVLPAMLGGSTLLAMMVATRSDVIAALVPLGGLMLAAGDFWSGSWAYTLLAAGSGVVGIGAMLAVTARDLEEQGSARRHRPEWTGVVRDGLMTAGTWWLLFAGPVLWGWAGNRAATEHLTVNGSLVAAFMFLVVVSSVAWARLPAPSFGKPDWRGLIAAAVVTVAGLMPAPDSANPWLVECLTRFDVGVHPGWLGLPLILLQEVWFRGFLQRAGLALGVVAWVLATHPGHPVAGVLSGLALGWAARSGTSNAILARLLALAALTLV